MGDFFVRRPIVATVIAIIMVIVGAISLISLPMEQYPNITPPVVEVLGNYTGANAVSVEQPVATPIEQEMNGVENMIYMKSTNSNDGTMRLQISFEVGSNPDGSQVKLEDVARVELGTENYLAFTRMNGKQCAISSSISNYPMLLPSSVQM